MTSKTMFRSAGLLYALTIAAGIFSEAVTTPANAVTAQWLYQLGVAAGLVCAVAYVGVTVFLYQIFEQLSPGFSRFAVVFSLIGIALLSMALTLLFAAPAFAANPETLRAILHLHAQAYVVADVFFGAYCLLIAASIVQSRVLPAWVAIFTGVAGAAYVLDSFGLVVAPGVIAPIADYALLPALAGECVLTIALIVAPARRSA